MQRNLFATLAGALFGTGLLISGMVDTTKVQGWLDVFGAWDPTLAFVLGGAILPMAIAWRIATRRSRSVLGQDLPSPPSQRIDRSLLLGSVLFGMGWGLAGLCPGPAMASLGFGGWGGLLFLVAMLAGMVAAPVLRTRLDRAPAPTV
ncbi:YeeE/YedE family protein [Szabonella alba]|uniref:YeeE/YedE family protein n=1 Tax=Szabonella alba TaxID=2804194 RepID=A0A8K0V848_9RHOB|nr:YeeE/YedE family protein [Szabonella alba]MBL4917123.1 YeeE/YedE family protein [Szabonella alba]